MDTQKNKLYFGNIPFDYHETQIEEIFAMCGTVEKVFIMRDPTTFRSQGYGFVTFADKDGVEAAMKINGQEVGGRPMKVNNCSRSKPGQEGNRLFVKNIPLEATEDEVKKVFAHCGSVSNFFFIRDHETRKPRGFGFLDFESLEGVNKALEMDGKNPFESAKALSVTKARPKQRNSTPNVSATFSPYNPYGMYQQMYTGYNGCQTQVQGQLPTGVQACQRYVAYQTQQYAQPQYVYAYQSVQPQQQGYSANYTAAQVIQGAYRDFAYQPAYTAATFAAGSQVSQEAALLVPQAEA